MTRAALPGLATQTLGRTCLSFDSLDSTSTYARVHAAALPDGAVILAGRQTQGKGRRGRGWAQVRPGVGLAMSVVLHRPDYAGVQTLPLCCGLAVSRALASLCGAVFPVKWPNDVLLGEKKVCGILCEAFEADGQVHLVCGIGVNLLQTQADFDALGLPHAASLLSGTGRVFSPQAVAATILNAWEPLLERFWMDGFAALADEYAACCVTLGREVRVVSAGQEELRGRALAVGQDGTLTVRTSKGMERVNAGEVSVRGLYGYV